MCRKGQEGGGFLCQRRGIGGPIFNKLLVRRAAYTKDPMYPYSSEGILAKRRIFRADILIAFRT